MNVIEPGQSITIGSGIPAQVTAVCIRPGGHVTYEVAWWSNGARCCQWLESCEVESSAPPKRTTIGFKGPSDA